MHGELFIADLRHAQKIVINLLHIVDLVETNNTIGDTSLSSDISTFISRKCDIASSNISHVVQKP
ncbi:hypothetical protein Hanom_Chr10g00899981 [Helianthus anomalus]